jgi:hypothetical protein
MGQAEIKGAEFTLDLSLRALIDVRGSLGCDRRRPKGQHPGHGELSKAGRST